MRRSCWVCLAFVFGCSSASDEPAERVVSPEGVSVDGSEFVFTTGDFEVPAGEERFLCYASTLDQDAVIDSYSYSSRAAIHHFVLANTLSPEPDKFSECDVLFRPTWSPLFISTTADATLDIPDGAANVLPAGTQLLIQLHLLNNSNGLIKDRAVVRMHRSPLSNPTPAGVYALGTTAIELPPLQTSTLQGTCTTQRDVKLFAMLPHMHYLGRAMRLEMGPDEGSLTTFYTKDPYDFDNQELDLLPLTIPSGYVTRTSCTYENTHDQMISFGESSLNEMCFAVGFAIGQESVGGCIQNGGGKQVPRDPNAGECADVVPNALGVGTACTKDGGQCAADLECSADLRATADGTGQCIRIGCTDAADCGGGSATCCSYSLADLCIPEACRPLDCVLK
jgi:hypothetical protein